MDMHEASRTVIIFAKILVALGATMLLFLDNETIRTVVPAGPPSPTPSPMGQVCLGLFFVASVILVAVWDCALAVLICLFLVCWIAVQQRSNMASSRGGGGGRGTGTSSSAYRSALVSQRQNADIQRQSAEDNDLQYLHAVNTPLPTRKKQVSLPMAFTTADRSYATCSHNDITDN